MVHDSTTNTGSREKTYLVTGAAGFIGSHLVEALLAQGVRVVGLDNFDDFYDPEIKRRNVAAALRDGGYELIKGDIREERLVENVLKEKGVDVVIHLAARAGVRPSIEQPLLYQSVNVEGTAVILEAMRATGCKRILFASSSSVYGNRKEVPFRESDAVDNPVSPYAATKKSGELLCYTYHHLFGFDVACLRFFTVYGPRQRPEMAIHKFTRAIASGRKVPVFGDGEASRDFTYIEDIIQGILSIEQNFSGYRILNLGESESTRLVATINLIGNALGVIPLLEKMPSQPGDVERTFADITAARELGYAPCTRLQEGIEKFVHWYRGQALDAQKASLERI